MYGHRYGKAGCAGPLITVPARRQRLIELFQAGNNISSLRALGQKEHDEKHQELSLTTKGRLGAGTAS